MKEQIIKTMKIREGFFDLLAMEENMSSNEKKTFWEAIKDLSWNGAPHERYLALKAVAVSNHELALELVPQIVERIDIEKEIELLPAVVSIIMELRALQYRDFFMEILNLAKKRKNEKVEYFAKRCLLIIDWRAIFGELREMIKKKDKLEIIDNIAFFRFENNNEEWHRFWESLDEDEKVYVKSLLSEIDDRIKNHYEAAERGARVARGG